MNSAFKEASIEAALRFYGRFFFHEKKRLIYALLGGCEVEIESDVLVIYCTNQRVVNGLASEEFWLCYAAKWLCLPSVIQLKIGTELIREINCATSLINSFASPESMTSLSYIFPPGLSERELIEHVLGHPDLAILVIEEQVVAASESYCKLTGKSLTEWLTDWGQQDGRRIHGNQSRHLPGVRERIVSDLEASETGLLLNYQWPAIFSRDNSTRLFQGHFQRVQFGDRRGRMLLLLGEPTLIANPEQVRQGCR